MSEADQAGPVTGMAVSPINGTVLEASADSAARARAGRVARRERLLAAAEAGTVEGVNEALNAGIISVEQAWQKLNAHLARTALGDGRQHVAATVALGRHIGAVERDKADPVADASGDLAELVAAWRQAKLDNPMLGQRAAGLVRGVDDGEAE
jgi:hypothetical protein